jgi:COP9 signalosome complex subunit 7
VTSALFSALKRQLQNSNSQLTMEQQRATNALESYILLSKDAKSPRAAADLVLRATSDPNTYVFVELLHMANIFALQQVEEYAGHYKHLEIFAWGTWSDYQCQLCYAHQRLVEC